MLQYFPDACPRITQPKYLVTNLCKYIQTIERIVNVFVPRCILKTYDKHTEKRASETTQIVNVIVNAKNKNENTQPKTCI